MLGWFDYHAPPESATQFSQSETTLSAIRFLTGPLGAIMLFRAIVVANFYPLTRKKYARIRRLLARRKERENALEYQS